MRAPQNSSAMPDQQDFHIFKVDPEDLGEHSRMWETCKRFKSHAHIKESCNCHKNPEKQIPANKGGPSVLNKSNRFETALQNKNESDDDCEVITFVLGATQIRDLSQPMPPPTRFVRK